MAIENIFKFYVSGFDLAPSIFFTFKTIIFSCKQDICANGESFQVSLSGFGHPIFFTFRTIIHSCKTGILTINRKSFQMYLQLTRV